jgi:hypothetical protein
LAQLLIAYFRQDAGISCLGILHVQNASGTSPSRFPSLRDLTRVSAMMVVPLWSPSTGLHARP